MHIAIDSIGVSVQNDFLQQHWCVQLNIVTSEISRVLTYAQWGADNCAQTFCQDTIVAMVKS